MCLVDTVLKWCQCYFPPTWYFIHSPGSGLLLLLWWSHYEYCHQGLGGASLSCSIRFECCLVHTFSLYVYRGAVTRQGWGLGLASSEPNNEKPSSIIISLLLYVASCHHSAACTGALWKTCKRVWRCWKIFIHSTWNWDTCLKTVTKRWFCQQRSLDVMIFAEKCPNLKWRQITSLLLVMWKRW